MLALFFNIQTIYFDIWHKIFGFSLANLLLISFIAQCVHKNKCFIKMDVFFKRMIWIDQINSESFIIIENSRIKKIKWLDVILPNIDSEFKLLTFYFNNEKYEIQSTAVNWYKLLKGFREHYIGPDATLYDQIDLFFNKLEDCEICGYVACYDNECQVCASKQPSNQTDRMAYIFQNQLKIFTPAHPEDAFSGFYDEDEEFEFNKNWKPLINYDDVKLYAKRAYKLAL